MKKKRNNLALFVLIVLIAFIFFYAISVYADVGDNNRYKVPKSNGDDSFGIFILIRLLFNLIFIFGPIPAFIIIGFLIYLYSKNKDKINSLFDSVSEGTINEADDVNPILKIKENDEHFKEEDFLNYAEDVFVKLQNAWTTKKWEDIRVLETDALFNKHQKQLEYHIRNNTTNIVEKIKIEKHNIVSYNVYEDYEIIKTVMEVVLRDYVVDANNNVIESSKYKDWHMRYVLSFMRTKGVKTKADGDKLDTHNCPNCGATLKITTSGKCNYCDSIITSGKFGWVLSDIKGDNI